MSWIRFDNGIGNHPKALELDEDLYLPALGLLLVAVAYCDQQSTDGFIPTKALRRIGMGDIQTATDELVRVGFLDEVDNGYQVHDYCDWQRSKEQIARAAASARKAGKKSGESRRERVVERPVERTVEHSVEPEERREEEESREEKRETRAPALPPCLSRSFDGTRWKDDSGSFHDSASKAFWATVQEQRGAAVVSSTDMLKFVGMISDTCPASCQGSEDEVASCLDVLCKAAVKTKGKPSPLFRKVVQEDR